MSKTGTKKTNWVAIVLLIIVLFATAFGALCYFDDGFKEKIFGKPDSAAGKELVSTTIVNETYGTFELSANSMILNYMEIQRDLLFENGTNFNYLMEESIDFYNSLNLSDEILLKKDCVVGILANTGTSGKFKSDGYITMWRDTYLNLSNNILIYSEGTTPVDLKYESYPIILFPDKNGNHDNDKLLDIIVNVYVQDYEYNQPDIDFVFKSPMLVISDKGVPLTEKIYKEMLDDSTTQITKHYKE